MSLPDDANIGNGGTNVDLDSPLKLPFESFPPEAHNISSTLSSPRFECKSPSFDLPLNNLCYGIGNELLSNESSHVREDSPSFTNYSRPPSNLSYVGSEHTSTSPKSTNSLTNSPIESPLPSVSGCEEVDLQICASPQADSNSSYCDSLPSPSVPSDTVSDNYHSYPSIQNSQASLVVNNITECDKCEEDDSFKFSCSVSYSRPKSTTALTYSFSERGSFSGATSSFNHRRQSISLPSSPSLLSSCQVKRLSQKISNSANRPSENELTNYEVYDASCVGEELDYSETSKPFYSLSPKSDRSSPISFSLSPPPPYNDIVHSRCSNASEVNIPCLSSTVSDSLSYSPLPKKLKIARANRGNSTGQSDSVAQRSAPLIGDTSSLQSEVKACGNSNKNADACVVDLTCDDDEDDDVEIVSMDQPVVFLCQEKNRQKRKRLKNVGQSAYADDPIVIGDNDALPGTSGGNRGESASSSGVILLPTSESSKNLPALLPSHSNPFSSREPQYFGDLLSQSVIPLDREEPILVGSASADGGKLGTSTVISQERAYGYNAARFARASSSRSVVEEPIPEDVLNDVSAIYAEDNFVRQLIRDEKKFARVNSDAASGSMQVRTRSVVDGGGDVSRISYPEVPFYSSDAPIMLTPDSEQCCSSWYPSRNTEPSSNNGPNLSMLSRLSNSSNFLRSIASYFVDSVSSSSVGASSSSVSSQSCSKRNLSQATFSSDSLSRYSETSCISVGYPFKHSGSQQVFDVEDSRQKNSEESSNGFSCPICFEAFEDIKKAGRTISSTVCGHIFCTDCLQASFQQVKQCPTCRKRLNKKQYHPLYI